MMINEDEDNLVNFDQEDAQLQQRRYLFCLNEPGGKSFNLQIPYKTARLQQIFEECAKRSHMPVDSLSWKKKKYTRAADSRKTIGNLFTDELKKEVEKEQFYTIELTVEYKAIGGN